MAAPESTLPCYMRVHIIGHEDAEDPTTHSKIVVYRTVIKYNVSTSVLVCRRIGRIQTVETRNLNAFFKALCELNITPTMELSLLNLFKIKERHLGPQIRGSILFVPHPRADGTSSEHSTEHPPIRRVFNGPQRTSLMSQTSLASNLSYGSSLRSSFAASQASTVLSPPPSTVSFSSSISTTDPREDKYAPSFRAVRRRKESPRWSETAEPLPPPPKTFEEQVDVHMSAITKMLGDDDLHLLTPKPQETAVTY
ncbi:hypothetical protein Ae201684P_021359 [Aphanomyces euteiches]|nr:hypothetical protein Ae201684P_021359 [Aphanomyces euteiches]